MEVKPVSCINNLRSTPPPKMTQGKSGYCTCDWSMNVYNIIRAVSNNLLNLCDTLNQSSNFQHRPAPTNIVHTVKSLKTLRTTLYT